MAVHPVGKSTEFRPGQYLVIGRDPQQGRCGPAHKLVDIRMSRLHYERAGGDTSWVYRRQVAYVCDTEEEANTVIQLVDAREERRETELSRMNSLINSEFANAARMKLGLNLAFAS